MAQPQFQGIVAAAAQESVVIADASVYSGSVAATSGTEIVDLYAPANTIASVRNMTIQIPAPAGASSGTHSIRVTNTLGKGNFLLAQSNFGSVVGLAYLEIVGDFAKSPSVFSPANNILNIYFDSAVGIRFIYSNLSNATQFNNRIYYVNYLKRVVG